jgi:hypothetical protein
MKRIRFISTGVLLLLLGIIVPTYALQEQHEQEAKPEKQEQQAKPEKQQQQKAAQQPKGQEQQQKQTQQAKPEKQQQQKAPQQAKGQEQQQKQPQQAKPEKQQQQKLLQQAKPEKQQQQRGPQQAKLAPQQETQQSQIKGGNNGGGAHGRIADDRYRASFGGAHRFHVSEGDFHNHRFQYGGYSFGFIDPWPQGWLYTDDVYVEYIDGGYCMFDAFHPGIRIAINIL